MENIIEFKRVSKSYHKFFAVRDLDFSILKEEIVAFLGPSGCGKTTILKLIAGFEEVTSGEIYLKQQLVSKKNYTLPAERRKVGMVFQDFALFPHLSVEDNIAFGLKGGAKKNRDKVQEMVELIDLPGKEKEQPYKLSGGEQQRVAIARALAIQPNIIMLDEPFSNLDAKLRIQLRDIIHYILKKQKVTTIFVTHDQAEAFSFADRIFLINRGCILQQGSPHDIYEKPSSPWIASFVGDANTLEFEKNDVCFRSLIQKDINLVGCPKIMIRPEDLQVEIPNEYKKANGVIIRIQYLGDSRFISVKMEDNCIIKVKVPKNITLQENQEVKLYAKNYYIFPENTI